MYGFIYHHHDRHSSPWPTHLRLSFPLVQCKSDLDLQSWRRRRMRIVGGTLEATSDVTSKITARIDLSKMVAVIDNDDPTQSSSSSSSTASNINGNSNNSRENRKSLDDDRPMSVERSFRLIFEDGDEIQFYADGDEEKSDW